MEETLRRIAAEVDRRRYGKYRGFVADNEDPELRGRVKVTIPTVLGDATSDWALPCLPAGGAADQGLFAVPEVGAQVWVEFEAGDVNRPVWVGTFWQSDADAPAEARVSPPTVRLLKTVSGHRVQLDDTDGQEAVTIHHKEGAELTIDAAGTVTVVDSKGNRLVLNADDGSVLLEDVNGGSLAMTSSGAVLRDGNGNKVEMASSGVTCKGTQIVVDGQTVMLGGQGGEPILKGSTFLSLFAAHVHPTAMGPSGPPIPAGEASALSSKVLTS